jgi:hypothetical protein
MVSSSAFSNVRICSSPHSGVNFISILIISGNMGNIFIRVAYSMSGKYKFCSISISKNNFFPIVAGIFNGGIKCNKMEFGPTL